MVLIGLEARLAGSSGGLVESLVNKVCFREDFLSCNFIDLSWMVRN